MNTHETRPTFGLNGDSTASIAAHENRLGNIYKQIAERIRHMNPGEHLTYQRDIKGRVYNIDFYPKGIIARRDIPQKVNFSRDYFGTYSYIWKPDYGEYCRDDSIPGKKVLEEIVQLDMILTPKDHEMRFFYDCPQKTESRAQMYCTNALNYYTKSTAGLMLIRDIESEELLGMAGAVRDQRDKSVYELGMEIAEKARGKGIADAAVDDLAGILKAGGTARTIVGNYLFTHGRKNEACNGLFIKKKTEAERGIMNLRKVDLGIDPKDPECKKFIITL